MVKPNNGTIAGINWWIILGQFEHDFVKKRFHAFIALRYQISYVEIFTCFSSVLAMRYDCSDCEILHHFTVL